LRKTNFNQLRRGIKYAIMAGDCRKYSHRRQVI